MSEHLTLTADAGEDLELVKGDAAASCDEEQGGQVYQYAGEADSRDKSTNRDAQCVAADPSLLRGVPDPKLGSQDSSEDV